MCLGIKDVLLGAKEQNFMIKCYDFNVVEATIDRDDVENSSKFQSAEASKKSMLNLPRALKVKFWL